MWYILLNHSPEHLYQRQCFKTLIFTYATECFVIERERIQAQHFLLLLIFRIQKYCIHLWNCCISTKELMPGCCNIAAERTEGKDQSRWSPERASIWLQVWMKRAWGDSGDGDYAEPRNITSFSFFYFVCFHFHWLERQFGAVCWVFQDVFSDWNNNF